MKTSALACCLIALFAMLAPALSGNAAEARKAAQTYFLVAQPDLPDPMFRDSVVLMLPPTGTPLVIGLIVNKPTKVKLSSIFPGQDAFKNRADTAYFGGPVELNEPLALIRSNHALKGDVPLFKDIYLDLKPAATLSSLGQSPPSSGMRLYLGRAQWTDEQLHSEMLENSWYKVPSDPQYVFSADPDAVWRNLVARAQAIETSAPCPRGVPALLRVTWPSPAAGLDEPLLNR